jgi:endonuclease/exonuclease/phosphatase family metal-dependent hydrolase
MFIALTGLCRAETFRLVTYNVESYLDVPTEKRRAKSPESKAGVVRSLVAARPDVLALQEMGTTNALLELRASLKAAGVDLPYWEHLAASDTNIHLAILSRFELVARRPHTNEAYLLDGRRFRVSRGFDEVDVQVAPNYKFTLINVHLKSRLPSPLAEESEMRLQEARLLSALVRKTLAASPGLNLAVLGDFNDRSDSKTMREILTRGKDGLFDTKPSEPEGSASKEARKRAVNWTYFYDRENTYSRIDYILISSGMKREWIAEESHVVRCADWGMASDHRPVVCVFEIGDR